MNESSEATLLTPEDRRKGEIQGIPVVLGDGLTWTLPMALLAPAVTEFRDRIFDLQTLKNQVVVGDVMSAAWILLAAAYDLTHDELVHLLNDADPDALGVAVWTALFGSSHYHRTYTAWVRSALLANGIDPAVIPYDDLPHVLRHLVKTGRAEEASSFIESAEAAGKRAALFDGMRN